MFAFIFIDDFTIFKPFLQGLAIGNVFFLEIIVVLCYHIERYYQL